MEIPRNILLVDKPKGITSFDVIRILRRKLNIKKMGHAGTLDPLASGLMIIGINDGTKKMSEFLKLPKTYVADILLGKKSETGDMEGKIIEEKSAEHITDEMVKEVIENFSGKHSLVVPMYSAIKVGGRPLYSIARKVGAGKTLTEKETAAVPPVKEMEVISIKLLDIVRKRVASSPDAVNPVRNVSIVQPSMSPPNVLTGLQTPSVDGMGTIVRVEMHVSSGSYIRTLAEELGTRLGVPAMLTDLHRTEIGEFSIKDSLNIDKETKSFISRS